MTCRIAAYGIVILIFASACSSQKQTSFNTTRSNSSTPKVVNEDPKFLDDISVSSESSADSKDVKNENNPTTKKSKERKEHSNSSEPKKANALRAKYATIMETEPEELHNLKLFQFIDDWYGTRYCMGGTTKTCIDCSGFVKTFYSSVYDITLPRTAREQYDVAYKISKAKLQQGDLLFFNTRGGVSHVGIYLQNNKFVHASTNNGVVISDMNDPYYAKHFIRAGRIDTEAAIAGGK